MSVWAGGRSVLSPIFLFGLTARRASPLGSANENSFVLCSHLRLTWHCRHVGFRPHHRYCFIWNLLNETHSRPVLCDIAGGFDLCHSSVWQEIAAHCLIFLLLRVGHKWAQWFFIFVSGRESNAFRTEIEALPIMVVSTAGSNCSTTRILFRFVARSCRNISKVNPQLLSTSTLTLCPLLH